MQSLFKWRHFEAEVILLCMHWYLTYAFSYRDLEEMMAERGLRVDHPTIYRWVQHSAPALEKRCRPHLKGTTDSWRVDETSVKVKGVGMDLYRAGDSQGKTIEFFLSVTCDAQAAKRFFGKALDSSHTVTPRVMTVDKHAAYPRAFHELQAMAVLPASCELRQSKYLNNLVEQDHRFIKRLVKPGMGFLYVKILTGPLKPGLGGKQPAPIETSCAVGAPLRMKKGRIEVATFQRKDDQQYTASKRVFETVLRCLDEPLHVAQSVRAERTSTKNTLYKNRHPLGCCRKLME